jgi:hypothetical protein
MAWRLKPGETLSAVAALTLLGLMSGTWFEHPTNADIPADAVGFQTTPNAWQALAVIDWVLLAAVVCVLSAAIVAGSGRRLQVPVDPAAVVTVVGGVCMALIGYRIIDPIHLAGVGYRRDLAIFLSFGAAGLISVGGLWTLRERGTSLVHELSRAAGRAEPEHRVRRGPAGKPYGVAPSARRAAGRLSPRRR